MCCDDCSFCVLGHGPNVHTFDLDINSTLLKSRQICIFYVIVDNITDYRYFTTYLIISTHVFTFLNFSFYINYVILNMQLLGKIIINHHGY